MAVVNTPLPEFRGLNKDAETGTLLPGQSPSMQDVRLTIRHEIEKMAGYAKWNSSQNPNGSVSVLGGFDYQKWDKITRRVVVGDTTKLFMLSQKSNILTANQSNVETNVTGFTAIGGGTRTRDTNVYYEGVASLKIVTGATSGDGAKVDGVSASAATTYTGSVYVKGTAADVIKFVLRDNTNGTETSTTATMTGQWQRVQVSHTMGALAVTDLEFHVTNNAAASKTVYCDAFMIEANTYAGHWTRGGDSGWTSILTSTSTLTAASSDPNNAAQWWEFDYANDLLIAANGLDKPYFWDGLRTSAQTIGGNVWESYANVPSVVENGTEFQVFNRGIRAGGDTDGASSATAVAYSYQAFANRWSTITSMPAAREELCSFFFQEEGVGHAVGGLSATSNYEYSLVNNAWSTLTALPANTRFGCGFAIGIYGYVAGGVDFATVRRYNRLTGAWSAMTSLGTASYAGGRFVMDDIGYKIGGATGGATHAIVEGYDPDANTWTVKQSLVAARSDGASSATTSFGAYYGGSDPTDSTVNEVFKPASNSWVAMTGMTTAQTHMAGMGFMLDDLLHVSGGAISSVPVALTNRYILDNGWQPASLIFFHQGYLFTNDVNNPARVLYSDLNKIRTQRYNAFIDLPIDAWVGGFRFQNALHCLSRDGGVRLIGTVFDPDITVGNQAVEEVPNMPGTTSHRSIVSLPRLGLVAWWSEGGPGIWDGNKFINLSERYVNGEPRGLVKFFSSTSNFAQGQHRYIVGSHHPDQNEVHWCLTTSGTSADDVYVWNYAIDEFYGPVNIARKSAFTVEDMSSDLGLPLIGTSDGYVKQLETGTTYDTAAIDGFYRTDFMMPQSMKDLLTFHQLYTIAKQSGNWNLTITTYQNWAPAATDTKIENLNNTNKVIPSDLSATPVNALQIQWRNANASEPFTVMKASVDVEGAIQGTAAE